MDFPTLYARAATGKVKQWSIKVESVGQTADIVTTYGYLDGKMQETRTRITSGKNLGKANETSPQEQAISEARSKWTKKKDEGYAQEKHSSGSTAESSVQGTLLPMLALDYHKRGHDIKFPCYAQPKLDGVRCIYRAGTMTSRLGKPFPCLEHIKEELQGVGLTLDGELYSDTLGFQEIVGIVKKAKPDRTKALQVKFVVYDLVSDEDYSKRLAQLKSLPKLKHVKVLDTDVCQAPKDLKPLHDKYVAAGYEGLILRNKTGGYVPKHRSANLQKYKEFLDDEFQIVGFTEGVGNEAGLIIWQCKTTNGKQFGVRPNGTHEERADMFKRGSQFVGKWLTVKFQELTNDGVPRFPTTMRGGEADIRDYE